jgi:ankyrin repeat protein
MQQASGNEAMELLLGRGDIQITEMTLRIATNGGRKTVRLLLEVKVDVDARARDGVTALVLAAENGQEAVMRLLLEKAVNPTLGLAMARCRCGGQPRT